MTLPVLQEVPDLDLKPAVACSKYCTTLSAIFAAVLRLDVVLSPNKTARCNTGN